MQQFIKNPYNPMFGPFAQGNNTAAPKKSAKRVPGGTD